MKIKSSTFLKYIFYFALFQSLSISGFSQTAKRTIHVFVALCDNEHQGIVPVPQHLGNGNDPENNLYWGAMYGVKTYFKKSKDWKLVQSINNPKDEILERLIFRQINYNVYIVADAYRGKEIKKAVIEFFDASAGKNKEIVNIKNEDNNINLKIGGDSD